MLTQLYTKRHSCVQTQFIRLEFNAEASSVEFREFIFLVTISLQSCQRSKSSSNSVDSSYFCRIAYRDLFSQMHALCRRHTFNHCNEPLWLNSRVKFTCGFSHSQGRYDAWNSRITTGLWQIPRPKYTLAKSWKTVSCHECKVWLPHGRLKASLGHTELKKAKLIRWCLNVRLFKRKTNIVQSNVIMKWLNDGMQVLGLAWSHKILTDTNMTTSYDPNILGMSSRCIMQVRFHNLRWVSSLAQDSPKVLVPPAMN